MLPRKIVGVDQKAVRKQPIADRRHDKLYRAGYWSRQPDEWQLPACSSSLCIGERLGIGSQDHAVVRLADE